MPGIAFNEAGDVLASAGSDGKLILWKPDNRQRLGHLLQGHGNEVWAVAFAPKGRSLVSAEGWNPGGGLSEAEDLALTEPAMTVEVTEAAAAEPEPAEAAEPEPAAAVEPEPAAAVENGSVRLWDPGTGEGAVLPGSPGSSRAVAFSPDGQWIAAGSRDKETGTLHLWRIDGKSGKPVEAAQWSASKPVNAVAFSPDGKSLFAAEGEDLVRWRLDQKPPGSQPLATHEDNIWSLLVRSTGTLLASDATGKVIEWDVATGKSKANLVPIPSYGGEILAAVAESPDGRFVAAGSWAGVLRCVYLWKMPSGEFLGCLAGHQKPVSAVAFARDDLVSADDGGLLIFWDPETRQEIGRVQHGSRINGLTVSRDGSTLAAASSDRTVLLLDLDWDAAARSLAGRGELNEEECATWVHFEPRPASCAREKR